MAYTKTTWTDNMTPLSAANMNHIETGIKDAHDGLANVYTKAEIDAHAFGTSVTVPRTLSNSNKTATYNYAFPADGYVVAYMTSADTIQTWGVGINGVMTLGLVLGSASQYMPLYVKKGMTLSGSVTASTATGISNLTVYFYPIQ